MSLRCCLQKKVALDIAPKNATKIASQNLCFLAATPHTLLSKIPHAIFSRFAQLPTQLTFLHLTLPLVKLAVISVFPAASGYTHYSGFSVRSHGKPACSEAAFLAQSTLSPEELDEILKVTTCCLERRRRFCQHVVLLFIYAMPFAVPGRYITPADEDRMKRSRRSCRRNSYLNILLSFGGSPFRNATHVAMGRGGFQQISKVCSADRV